MMSKPANKVSRKTKTKKNEKSSTDPNRPKRPLSAYNLFFRDERQRWIQEDGHEGLTSRQRFTKMGQDISKRWKSLSETERKPYQDKAAQCYKKWQADLAMYRTQQFDKVRQRCGRDEESSSEALSADGNSSSSSMMEIAENSSVSGLSSGVASSLDEPSGRRLSSTSPPSIPSSPAQTVLTPSYQQFVALDTLLTTAVSSDESSIGSFCSARNHNKNHNVSTVSSSTVPESPSKNPLSIALPLHDIETLFAFQRLLMMQHQRRQIFYERQRLLRGSRATSQL